MKNYSELFQFQLSLLGLAAFLDAMFNASGVKKYWNNKCADWWYKLETIGWPQYIEINERFQELFSRIYGNKTFSFKRILTSSISSVVFVICIFYMLTSLQNSANSETNLMLGSVGSKIFTNTISVYSFNHILLLIYLSITINLFPDIISLAETGWILKISHSKNKHLLLLFLLGLFLSTIIFAIWNLYLIYFDPVFSDWATNNSIMSLYTFNRSGSPLFMSFLISTYATSFLWFSFIIIILVLGSLKRLSKTFSYILERHYFTKLPVSSLISFLCLCYWPIFLIYNFLSNIWHT